MSTSPAVSPALLELLAIFTSDLHDMRFGDFDASVLKESVEAVHARAEAVAAAEEALAEARARLGDAQDALAHTAVRALAYARIYAEARPALAARLETVATTLGSRAAASPAAAEPKKRGRPRKVVPGDGVIALPLGPSGSLVISGASGNAEGGIA